MRGGGGRDGEGKEGEGKEGEGKEGEEGEGEEVCRSFFPSSSQVFLVRISCSRERRHIISPNPNFPSPKFSTFLVGL